MNKVKSRHRHSSLHFSTKIMSTFELMMKLDENKKETLHMDVDSSQSNHSRKREYFPIDSKVKHRRGVKLNEYSNFR